jgi:hypothetical protein
MGSVHVASASGTGSQSLGGAQPVVEFLARLLTAGDRVSIDGVSDVRRLHHAGWVGLTEAGTTPPGSIVVWKTYIENEFEDKAVEYAFSNDPDTLFWDITPGTSVELWVYW